MQQKKQPKEAERKATEEVAEEEERIVAQNATKKERKKHTTNSRNKKRRFNCYQCFKATENIYKTCSRRIRNKIQRGQEGIGRISNNGICRKRKTFQKKSQIL